MQEKQNEKERLVKLNDNKAAYDAVITLLESLRYLKCEFLNSANALRRNLSYCNGMETFPSETRNEMMDAKWTIVPDMSIAEILKAKELHTNRYALYAITQFRSGGDHRAEGCGSPEWVLDCDCESLLEKITQLVLTNCKQIVDSDTDHLLDDIVDLATEAAYPDESLKWDSSIGVKWGYLRKLESVIAEIRKRTATSIQGSQCDDKETVTLSYFLENYCGLTSSSQIISKKTGLFKLNKDGEITLPDIANEWTKGGKKIFYTLDLIKQWPAYCKVLPSLPKIL